MEIVKGRISRAQKVLVYGPEGVGKSTFASQFPGCLFVDTEAGTNHLDVSRLPAPTSWTMLLEEVRWVRDTKPDGVATLAIDTADWAEMLCAAHVCAAFGKGQAKGIEDFGYGKGYTWLAEEFGRFLNLLTDVVEAGINVVLCAHAQIVKFEQPDESGAYDRWTLKLQKKTAPLALEWADMVLFANFETIVVKDGDNKAKGRGGSKRIMCTQHAAAWDAKNRHGLPDRLPLEYAAIAVAITGAPQGIAAGTDVATIPEIPAFPEEPPSASFVDGYGDTDVKAAGKDTEPGAYRPQPPPVFHEVYPDYYRPLLDLMEKDGITIGEFCAVAEAHGRVAKGTAFADYLPELITEWGILAWPKLVEYVEDRIRYPYQEEVPF